MEVSPASAASILSNVTVFAELQMYTRTAVLQPFYRTLWSTGSNTALLLVLVTRLHYHSLPTSHSYSIYSPRHFILWLSELPSSFLVFPMFVPEEEHN
jgi:hypothetical protein